MYKKINFKIKVFKLFSKNISIFSHSQLFYFMLSFPLSLSFLLNKFLSHLYCLKLFFNIKISLNSYIKIIYIKKFIEFFFSLSITNFKTRTNIINICRIFVEHVRSIFENGRNLSKILMRSIRIKQR